MAGTAPPRLQIGETTCHILSDGKHRSDGGAFFGVVPRILWERVVQPDARNMIPVDVRCLLIETGDQKILVDTGHGDKFDAKLRKRYGLPPERDRLVADLARAGFAPEDVTAVLMTHLHADHAGGMTRWRDHVEGGPVEPVFPNAAYIVQGREYDAATHPNERTVATYYPDNWQVLTGTGQLRMVMGGHDFGPHVRTETAAGHTESLQVVWVESEGESLLFLGDAANFAVHLERLPWVPAFDEMPLLSMEAKKLLRTQILEKNPLLVFQHDPRVVTGRLVQSADERFTVVEEIVEEPAWDRGRDAAV